jgi:hypothetical protein
MHYQYWSLLGGVVPVFLIMAAGFGVRRIGWLTAESDNSLLRLTINVLYPCLIFDSILGNAALDKVGNVVLAPAVGFVTVVASFALCALAARMLPLDNRQARTFAFTTGICNYGYIALPLVQKFFDRETVGVLFAHNFGVEIAFWTAGILTLAQPSNRRGIWKQMFNAPVLAILVSLLLNFCRAHEWIPSFLTTTAHMLGQSSVPVAVILTGAILADLLAQNHPPAPGVAALLGCALRLLVLPVLLLLLARILPCSVELKRIVIVMAAMPSAMMPIIITKHYGGDANIAMQIVLATTLAGLVTIPLWIQIGLRFVGV